MTRPGFSVAFVSTFAPDEPVEAVLRAATWLPDVNFYVTGDTRKLSAGLRAQAPPNVSFTGFLDPYSDYPGLLRAADAVMVLTTRDYTLQLGGCEAAAVGKPLITSDWPYLREVFAQGAVFVGDSAESIRDGVLELQRRHAELSVGIVALREASRHEWDLRMRQLMSHVAGDGSGRAGPAAPEAQEGAIT
jgi:glycosyltransferase involved in cell wall biosynthesis